MSYKPTQPLVLQKLSNKYERLGNKSQPTKECEESAKHLALEWGRKSTIHAMNRIFQQQANKYERFFWFVTLVSALFGCIYVCFILSRRYNAGSLQTVVETTKKPVFEIPFPEVVICNANRLNWDRITEAKQRFMPNETNIERIQLFERVIGMYDNLEFGVFSGFNQLKSDEQQLHLVNNINFSLVFDFMVWRCEEILTDCIWHHDPVNCCEIFVKAKSLLGICWHFNTLSTKESRRKALMDNKYPRRTGTSGPTSGLKLRILINDDKHYRKKNDKGVLVSVREPNVYHKAPLWIPANTEALLEVRPIIYFYENGTKRAPTMIRQCFFTDERSNKDVKYLTDFPYMFENCEAQCRQLYLVKYCNCTLDLLFPNDKYPSCQVKDLLCLAHNNEHFHFTYQIGEEQYVNNKVQGMICTCYRNCYSLRYVTDARSTLLPHYLRANISFIDMDVHFQFEIMMVYRTTWVLHWVDLMGSCGAIASLFLGCSLISGIELLYFSLVELPTFMYHILKSKRKRAKSVYNDLNAGQLPRKRCNWNSNKRIRDVQLMVEAGSRVIRQKFSSLN